MNRTAMWAMQPYSRAWAATGTALAGVEGVLAALGRHQRRRELPKSPAVHVDLQVVERVAEQASGAVVMRRQWLNRALREQSVSAASSASSSTKHQIADLGLCAGGMVDGDPLASIAHRRPWITEAGEASELRGSTPRERNQWS
ncbi:hypothetical protein VPH35_019613 [Triticum aestivum]